MINCNIGISTACFYPDLTEVAFDKICAIKPEICEIFINTQSETNLSFLKAIKQKADDNNIKIISVHPFYSSFESFFFFGEYKRRFYDGIELYKSFFEAAQFLGAKYIILHATGIKPLKISMQEYCERLATINETANKFDCEIVCENVGYANNYIAEMRQINDKLKFALDFKHAISWGCDVRETAEKMGANLAHVHINDMILSENLNKDTDVLHKISACKLPFFGDLDYKNIFEIFSLNNYIGGLIIEVYSQNYENISEIKISLEKLKEFVNNL